MHKTIHGKSPRTRLRRHFSWTLPANMLYGVCQLALLVVLNKLGSTAAAGEFSLGLAIAAPVFMFANLRLNTIVASDMRRVVPIGNYFRIRLKLLAIALVITAIIISQHAATFRWLLVVIACVKVTEAMSDLCCGMQQRIERLDRVAISFVANGLTMALFFVAVYYVSRQLHLAVLGLFFARVLVLAVYDVPMARLANNHTVFSAETLHPQPTSGIARSILFTAAPLGITAALVSLTSNIPRYIIADALSEEVLGMFCSVAIALQAGNLVFRAVEQPAVPRLAALLHTRNAVGFWRLLGILTAMFMLMGTLGVVASLLIGPTLLTWVYTPAYYSLSGVLACMVVATSIGQVAGIIESSLIAARLTAVQIPMHGVTVVSCLVLSVICVPWLELYGAVLALSICRLPFIVMGVWLLRRKLAESVADQSDVRPTRLAA